MDGQKFECILASEVEMCTETRETQNDAQQSLYFCTVFIRLTSRY